LAKYHLLAEYNFHWQNMIYTGLLSLLLAEYAANQKCSAILPIQYTRLGLCISGMTKYRKGPQRSITQDHRGSAIMRKPPDLQQFCVKLHFFTAFCNAWYLQSHV